MLKNKMLKIMFKEFFGSESFARNDRGAAAIEFAFIMPFMIFLYFGLIDVTGLISMNRRVVSAAATIADLIGQQKTSILASTISDQYNAVYVIMQPVTSANVRVEIFDYRTVNGTITLAWKTNNGQSSSCGTAPSTANMANLVSVGNDLIVARVCTTYTPTITSFLGTSILGATSFSISQSISVRPRSSLSLNCYATTVAAGTFCS